MKEYLNRLPILDVNPDMETAARLYPIQPYRMDEDVHVSFPSKPHKDFVAFYHQIQITEKDSRYICQVFCSSTGKPRPDGDKLYCEW